jgi:hypothetical protein
MRSALKARIMKLEQARQVSAMPGVQIYCDLPSLGHSALLFDSTGVQTPVSYDEILALCALDERRAEDMRRNLLSRQPPVSTPEPAVAPIPAPAPCGSCQAYGAEMFPRHGRGGWQCQRCKAVHGEVFS